MLKQVRDSQLTCALGLEPPPGRGKLPSARGKCIWGPRIYAFVCTCLCIYARTHAHMCAPCAYTCRNTLVKFCACTYMCVHLCTLSVHMCMLCVHVHTRVYSIVCVCKCTVSVYVCLYTLMLALCACVCSCACVTGCVHVLCTECLCVHK